MQPVPIVVLLHYPDTFTEYLSLYFNLEYRKGTQMNSIASGAGVTGSVSATSIYTNFKSLTQIVSVGAMIRMATTNIALIGTLQGVFRWVDHNNVSRNFPITSLSVLSSAGAVTSFTLLDVAVGEDITFEVTPANIGVGSYTYNWFAGSIAELSDLA